MSRESAGEMVWELREVFRGELTRSVKQQAKSLEKTRRAERSNVAGEHEGAHSPYLTSK